MSRASPLHSTEQVLVQVERGARFEVVADRVWGHAPRPGHWKSPPMPPLGRLPHTSPVASMARMRAVCALLALEADPSPDVTHIRKLIRTLGSACAPSASRANMARKEPTLVKILASAWSLPPQPAMETLLLMGVALGIDDEPGLNIVDLHGTLGMNLSLTEAAFTRGTQETRGLRVCASHLSETIGAATGASSFYEIARAYGSKHDLPDEVIPCLVALGALVPASGKWLARAQESITPP